MRTRLKICGLRSAAAVRAAVEAGADALGFNFYPPSPRSLTVDQAAALMALAPPYVERVALFVNEPAEAIRSVTATLGCACVQLHGEPTVALCASLTGLRTVLGVAAVPGRTVAAVAPFVGAVDAVLVDAAVAGAHGGTGQVADWCEVVAVREAWPELPVILAGGLTPANVGQAIRAVRPYAVDVASGVECAPGVKDSDLIRAFAAAVRDADGRAKDG